MPSSKPMFHEVTEINKGECNDDKHYLLVALTCQSIEIFNNDHINILLTGIRSTSAY